MKVLFWIVKNRKNKLGNSPISCRITISGKRREIYTGIYIKPNEFKNGKIRVVSQVHETYNNHLSEMRNNLFLTYYNILKTRTCVTAKEIKEAYIRNKTTLNIKELLSTYEIALETSSTTTTKKVISQRLNAFYKCLDFLEMDNLMPHEMSHETLNKVKKAFIEKLKKSESYTRAILTSVTMGFGWCFNNGLIKTNPLHGYRTRLNPAKKLSFLNDRERDKLWKVKLSQKQSDIRDFGLIQCNTGLSYSDVIRVKPKHIYTDKNKCHWILINRKKVPTADCQIPITTKTLNLFKKHNWDFTKISYSTIMRQLASIAKKAGINKKITTHLFRKTFAVILLNEDVPIETVSKLLGHKSVRTTENYYATVLQMKIARDVRGIVEKNEMLQPA